jgi:diguanylate cyclase (GGDEF)-like protein/PAS domain S-box-containing protein
VSPTRAVNRRHTDRDSTPPASRRTAIDIALRAMLDQHPDALVAAIDGDARGGFVDAPPQLPFDGHRVLQATSMLDVVVPADRIVVIETWERARADGIARAPVRLLVDPEASAMLHFLDVRAEYGVLVGIVIGDTDRPVLTAPPPSAGLPPRLARVRKDALAIILDIDPATTLILGWTNDILGHRTLEFIHPDDHERAIQSWLQMLANPAARQAVRLRHRRADGSWLWMEVANLNLLDDPTEHCVLTEMIDISDEMAALEALRAREQMLNRLAEALPIGILQIAADGAVVYVNDRLSAVLGPTSVASLDGHLAAISADDRPDVDLSIANALADGIDRDVEVHVQLTEPTRSRRCLLRIRALSDQVGESTGAIICVEDVTRSAELRAELELQASHDMLTRVLNRRAIMALLDRTLAAAPVVGTAVIFIDLDRFKEVNDRLGHLAGDEVLRVTADRIAASVRSVDMLGRVGGDEFLVVCPNVRSPAMALRIARRVANALHRSVALAGGSVDVRASVGLAFSLGGLTRDELVEQADAAMYGAKRTGQGGLEVHT